jgi:alkylation response protein AidB-like acyl-CoA dehydrogenase
MSIAEIKHDRIDGDTGDVEAVLARARPVLAQLAAEAAGRELDRDLPTEAVRALAATGLGALRIPREFGGAGVSIQQLFGVIIELSAADSNVAQALRAHFGITESLLASARPDQWARWFPRIVGGAILGNATTEASTSDLRTYQTTLRPAGPNLILSGQKFYSTGTLYADLVAVAAQTAQGTTATVLIPVDRAGVELDDDWDGFGQRLSASGSTRFRDVLVYPHEILDDDWENRPQSHLIGFFQLFLAGVLAGIAGNVTTDVVELVRARKRTYGHASAENPPEDPLIQQVVGDIASHALAAESLVLTAAAALDRAYASGQSGVPDPELYTAASITVAQAHVVVASHVLTASEALFNAGSASSTSRTRNLDRHWRNARVLASHNPLIYKTRVVGDYLINGTPPPPSGFF